MNVSNRTILITGGGSGIGLAIAESLLAAGNRLVITGRSAERLNQAVAQLPGTTAIPCDVTDATAVAGLVQRLEAEFPDLSVLINNAGTASSPYALLAGADAATKAEAEMAANYLAPIRLTELLLPLLGRQPEAAVVTVSSIVAFVPAAPLATYAASKAALHSYSQALRLTLAQGTNIKVFELMPPLVNTAFSAEIGGSAGIPPQQVADELLAGFAKDEYEIHVGQTADLYQLYRADPAAALQLVNANRQPVK